MKRVPWVAGAAVAFAFCVASPSRAADPPDGWLTTKAKVVVLGAVGTSSRNVHVDTTDGIVTLHGTVSSEKDRVQAESAVRGIEGVKKVRNLLEVVTADQKQTLSSSDAATAERVKMALRNDLALRDETGIHVVSVNNGTVLLGGTTKTLSNHLRAVEDARAVAGVRRVASTIESPDSKAVRDTAVQTERLSTGAAAPSPERSLAQSGKDAYITSMTKARLLADSNTPSHDINVDTKNGVVTLFGSVPSQESKHNAVADARKVSGVQKVIDELEVVPPEQRSRVSGKDETLRSGLEKAISKDENLSDASIHIDVANGVARLTGTAPNEITRREAETIAKNTSGVRSVRNEIEVRSD
jgi:hyperosmotically inducible protein